MPRAAIKTADAIEQLENQSEKLEVMNLELMLEEEYKTLSQGPREQIALARKSLRQAIEHLTNARNEAVMASNKGSAMNKTASGYNDSDLPGRFFEKKADLERALEKVAKKKGSGGPAGMAKSIKGEEHPHAACMDKVRRHKIDVEDPEAFCAEAVDIAKGTTHWRGKEKD